MSQVALTTRGGELQAPLQATIAALNAELDATLGAADSAHLRERLRVVLTVAPPTTR